MKGFFADETVSINRQHIVGAKCFVQETFGRPRQRHFSQQ